MFLGSYEFEGDTDALQEKYDRLMAEFPTSALLLHLCVRTEGGIAVYDACPSEEAFDEFAASATFAAAVSGAGLPRPRVRKLGDVHATHIADAVGR